MNRLDNADTFALANLLAKKLSLDLDAKDMSSVDYILNILMDFPQEVVVFVFQNHIGIQRIIDNKLDLDINFKKIYKKVSLPYETQG